MRLNHRKYNFHVFDIVNVNVACFSADSPQTPFPILIRVRKLALGTVLKSIHCHQINSILQRRSQVMFHSTMQMNLLKFANQLSSASNNPCCCNNRISYASFFLFFCPHDKTAPFNLWKDYSSVFGKR